MANCNRQQLNITCGTDVVLHDRLVFDGETFDPALSVGITANLVSSLGKRTPLTVEVADGALIITIPWVDGRTAGYYGLEVTGSCNHKKWATYADGLIHYTRATEMGAVEVEMESDYYDITQVVAYRYSESPISFVSATVDDGVGEPSVDFEYENRKLSLAFHNINGNGIVNVEQTTTSLSDEGENVVTFTDKLGNEYNFVVRNGKKGSTGAQGNTGDSAIFDPSTGNISQIKQDTGDNTLSPMSQKATTKAIMASVETGEFVKIDFSQYTRQAAYIYDGDWSIPATTLQSSCYFVPIDGWKKLKLHPRVVSGVAQKFQIAFLASENDVRNNQPAITAEDTSTAWVENPEDRDYEYDVPIGAATLYVRYNSSGTSYMPSPIIHDITVEDAFSAVGNEIQVERERVDGIKDKEVKHLFLGTLVQKALTQTTLSDSTERVSTLSVMAIPIIGLTLKFKLPELFFVGIRSGGVPDNLSSNNYWFGDGDTFTFAAGARFFRLCFCKKTGTNDYQTIEVEEVTSRLANGTISITYDNTDDTIIRHNSDNEKFVKAAMRNLVSGINNNGDITKQNLPTFAHTSDVHGDVTRFKRFAEYCDYLGVDAAMVSGDMVGREPNNRMNYIDDVADTCTTPVMICMGNHDARSLTEQQQYEQVMQHLITKNESIVDTEKDYPTYYYQDFAAKKIRLISLNLYEATHSGDNVNFTQQQCEWFIEALVNTPQDYGVMVMFHSPETMPAMESTMPEFYQTLKNYSGVQTNITGKPFAKIIDAFIGKESTEITYAIGSTSITVTADFTNLASGVEFIAWVNGHLHSDTIGYIGNTTHLQLNLNVCCCSAVYGTASYPNYANLCDLPRGYKGSTQDAFNIYAIDRPNKTVKVARVGSSINYQMQERKIMTIPYAIDEN